MLIDGQVVDVHGAVEGEGDHLRDLGQLDLAGDFGAVGRAEAVGQNALCGVTSGCRVRVLVHAASGLIGTVLAICQKRWDFLDYH